MSLSIILLLVPVWLCNFERVCALNNTDGDDFDWDVYRSGVTPSEDTGPSGDHTLRDGDGIVPQK